MKEKRQGQLRQYGQYTSVSFLSSVLYFFFVSALLFCLAGTFIVVEGFTSKSFLNNPKQVPYNSLNEDNLGRHALFRLPSTPSQDEYPPADPNDPSSSRNDRPRPRRPSAPLIGPLPMSTPLLLGSSMTIQPTPLQWKALEEAVVLHRNHLIVKRSKKKSGDFDDNNVVDASPIVAVIDEVSGITPVRPPGSTRRNGRYATLAAVVGMSTKTNNKNNEDNGDEMSFMEKMMEQRRKRQGIIHPLSSSVRLVGVGRAVLGDFFNRMPTPLMDEDGSFLSEKEGNLSPEEKYKMIEGVDDDDDDEDDDDDDGYLDKTPIIMAEFDALLDDGCASWGDLRSAQSSPVHAMAELSRLARMVDWMHNDRRKLVAGLTAAKARLNLVSGNNGAILEYDDYDGLGLIGGGGMNVDSTPGQNIDACDDDECMDVDEFLAAFPTNNINFVNNNSDNKDDLTSNSNSNSNTKNERLDEMDNYGINYYSAFSTIPDLTKVAMKTFEPYYSEVYREREEHELEILSFVSFRALEGFADPLDIAWALRCTSSIERLYRAYEIMFDHRVQLEKLAKEVSQKLRDCGEECTDLW